MKKRETTDKKTTKKPRGQGKRFSSDYQPSGKAKSDGQIEKRKEENYIFNWRTFLEQSFEQAKGVVQGQLDMGDLRDYKEIMKICKPNEKQDIGLTGDVGIQKVFITKKDIKDTDKHIDDIIEG